MISNLKKKDDYFNILIASVTSRAISPSISIRFGFISISGSNISDAFLAWFKESYLNELKKYVDINLNQHINVKIARKNIMGELESIVLTFQPRKWSGQGYTGFALTNIP